MTNSLALAALRRAVIPAALMAVLTGALLTLFLTTRPPSYSVRVGIVAEPVGQVSRADAAAGYGEVVALTMAALPEAAFSRPVLEGARAKIPGFNLRLLESSVSVDVVPGSGVARIKATSDSPEHASALLDVVLQVVDRSDLLAPVGQFRVIGGSAPRPRMAGADRLLVTGLTAAAAVLIGLITAATLHLLKPKLLTGSDVKRVVDSIAASHVPVVVLRGRKRDLDLIASTVAVASPGTERVHLVPADGTNDDGLGEALNQRLPLRPIKTFPSPPDTGQEQRGQPSAQTVVPEAAVVLVRLRRTTAEQLSAAMMKAQAVGHAVAAVVATTGRE